ncbi:DNRLRE domain-containing protein [Paenibacillus woosongensis]|uniref:DNRLRE domain-containing protein n=1 Tax=Paenibacillus woosongensis TaxID=307580 RepID=A0ABQ4MQ79_9BACL|nr:DNRLRE domain-containing protein [Paenibacillus woosongensis]GIP58123.1 hypothetical protein J15TS10_19370 [Paenibacillus woosongensis]
MFRIVEQTQAHMQQGYFSNSDIYVDGYGKLTLVNRNMQTNLALNKPYTKTLNAALTSSDVNNIMFTDGNKNSFFRYASTLQEDITVDLGSEMVIGGTQFFTGATTNTTQHYVEILISSDGNTFRSISKEGTGLNQQYVVLNAFTGVRARYVKFSLLKNTPGIITVSEGEIYAGHSYTGYREHIYDISSVGTLRTNNAFWMEETPYETSVIVETSISLDSGATWSTWQPLINGSSIQNVPLGTDISNGRLKVRATLSTNSINVPSFYNFNMYFDDIPKTDEKYIIIPRNAYSLNKITPEMASPNTPAPYVATGTGTAEPATPTAWKLFDGIKIGSVLSDTWRPYGIGTYAQIDLGSGNAKAISGYHLYKHSSSSGLRAFRIEGSFDGLSWETVDEQLFAIWSGNEFYHQLNSLKHNKLFRYYRLYMTTTERPYLWELELFELVDGNGYQIKSSLTVPYGTSLPSKLYIPPHNKATGYVDVRGVYRYDLPATVGIKVHNNLLCRINVPINNRASAIVKIVQQPTKTLSLSPIKDAFVRESTPKFNYGTEQDLYVGYNSKFNEKYRSFVEFDISALPADQIIKSAHFKLFHELEGTPVQKVEIYELDREWNERGITWDNQPLPISKIAELDVGNAGGYLVVDFTDIVKDWYEGNKKNNGFIIKLEDESEQYYKRFYSRESRNIPMLDIEYIDQTVYTYEKADLRNNHLLVRQNMDKSVAAKINVNQVWFRENIKSRVKIANMGVIDGTLAVKDPVIPSKINVRQFATDDLTAKLSVLIKGAGDIPSTMFVNRKFAFARLIVREKRVIGLTSKMVVRVKKDHDLQSIVAVKNPYLSARISVVKSEYLPGKIFVVGNGEKILPAKIFVQKSDFKDIAAHIRVFEKQLLPGTLFVKSGYLKARLSIPETEHLDLSSRIRVRVKWAADLKSRIVIDDPNGDSQGYVYIL